MINPNRSLLILATVFILLVILAACNAPAPETEGPTPEIETRVALTLQALETPVTPEPTATTAPTDTAEPTATQAPTETTAPSATTVSTDTPVPTTTPIPGATSNATQPPASVATAPPTGGQVFFDNFDSELGWYVNEGENAIFEFVDGGYQISNNLVNGQFWSVRSVQPLDTVQEVDATRRAGPTDGYYGVVCRQQEDGKNYYALVIGSDGFYGIAIMVDGAFSFLLQGVDDLTIIDTEEGAVNRVRGDCNSNRFSLYANNIFLAEVVDNTFTSGQIGMFNGTREEPGLVVLFDNYSVSVPLQ